MTSAAIAVLGALFCTSAFAFDAARALEIAKKLGSNEFEGRRSGHPGGTRAEQYIADYCKEIGLAPGNKESYFQDVPMLVHEEVSASLSIAKSELGKITFHHGLDFTVCTHSGSGYMQGEVVLVGHGIVAPEKGRDDYQEMDVKGKVIVILRGQPTSNYSFEAEDTRGAALKIAKERGAAAVLWHSGAFPVHGAAIDEEHYDAEMPLIYIGDRALQVLLENTGKSLRTYKTAIDAAPMPIRTGKEVTLSVRTKELKNRRGRNVIGLVYGSDPVLRNELIVIGAHLDHVGMNANRAIYNGADDDASGSGLIAELARSVVDGEPLKRTVVFIWFTGEEDGLLGSKHFAENTTLPFGNIAVMMNFDMVGQGDGGCDISNLDLLGDFGWDYADSLHNATQPIETYASDNGGSSDYAPFVEGGAPGVAFWSSGSHPFYHQLSDDAQWLSEESFAAVGRQAEALLERVGHAQSSMASRSDSLKLFSRQSITIDVDGFFVDATGTVKASRDLTCAWLPHDAKTPMIDLVNRCASLHEYCDAHHVSSKGLKTAVDARGNLKHGVFLAMPERGLTGRSARDAATLTKMGLSVVHLTPGDQAVKLGMNDQVFDALESAGIYAMIPLDYNTAPRVLKWGSRAIVTASLKQFAELDSSFRASLISSEALLLLDVLSVPDSAEIEAIRLGRQRLVHLNYGESYDDLRETEQKETMTALMQAGFSRDDLFCLFNGNLRRYFGGD